jgi:hypothetical protein
MNKVYRRQPKLPTAQLRFPALFRADLAALSGLLARRSLMLPLALPAYSTKVKT